MKNIYDVIEQPLLNKTESTVIDANYDKLFYMLNAVELVFVIFSILIFTFCNYIIIETPLLHFNFMRLYKCLYIEFSVHTYARIIKLVAVLVGCMEAKRDEEFVESGPLSALNSGFFGWLQIIRLVGEFCSGCCFIFLVVERVLATIMLKNYETLTNNGISIVFIVMHIIMAILGVTLFVSEIIPFTLEAIGIGVILPGCAIGLFLLRIHNIQLYKKSKLENSSYTLSEKFQISENVRALIILWRSYLVAVAFIVFMFCLILLSMYLNNLLVKRLVYVAFNITVAIYINIAAFTFVFSTEAWKRSLNEKLCYFKKLICAPKISDQLFKANDKLDYLKTLDGQKMVYSLDEEREIYFGQLAKEWE